MALPGRNRVVEAAQSARPYVPIDLPLCGRVVRCDFRADALRKTSAGRRLRVVTWNLEFGYVLR